jgi:hypothetical protein
MIVPLSRVIHGRHISRIVMVVLVPFTLARRVVVVAALAAITLALPGIDALAASSRHKTKAHSSTAKSAPRPAQTSCAEYGAGFMPMQGSSTCIKFGGSIGVGVGGQLR